MYYVEKESTIGMYYLERRASCKERLIAVELILSAATCNI